MHVGAGNGGLWADLQSGGAEETEARSGYLTTTGETGCVS